jgi:HSP20 family protein
MVRTLVRWDPWTDLETLRHEMDRVFDESLVRRYGRGDHHIHLPVDVYATDDDLVVVVALPGLEAGDVEVVFEGDTLTIKGELPAPIENVDYLVQERRYGPFHRSIDVGVPVQAEKIEATFDRGMLTVTLPKVEEVKPKTIQVKVR